MYESYYQLRAKPFQLTPDPRFFFNSQGHKRALAYLRYGVRQGEGFIVITGNVGTGKSTLVSTLFKSLEKENVVAAQVVTTQLQADDLLRMVAGAFGLPFEDVTKAVLLRNLETFFRACMQEGKRTLLVVDEAQNLPRQSVEELRMLSNFQMGGRGLLQSFLLGQKEFKATMRSEGFEQLRQRVIAAYHLKPLNLEETQGYIEHRLLTAGWQGDPHFAADAYQGIYEFTEGVPRRINTLCDRILLFASLEELHEIGGNTILSVTQDIIEEQGEPTPIASPDPSRQLSHRGAAGSWHGVQPATGGVGRDAVFDVPPDGAVNVDPAQRLQAVEHSMDALTNVLREEMAALRRELGSGARPAEPSVGPAQSSREMPSDVNTGGESYGSALAVEADAPAEADDSDYFQEELAVLRKALLRNTRRDAETEG